VNLSVKLIFFEIIRKIRPITSLCSQRQKQTSFFSSKVKVWRTRMARDTLGTLRAEEAWVGGDGKLCSDVKAEDIYRLGALDCITALLLASKVTHREQNKIIDASAYIEPGGGSQLEDYPLLDASSLV
jgi:hypothetical protein